MLRRKKKKMEQKTIQKKTKKKKFVLTENEIFSFDALNCVLREYEILTQGDGDNINFYCFFVVVVFFKLCSAPPVI